MTTLLLTGKNGDIGQAIAEKFLREGVEVIAPTRQEMDLECKESIDKYMQQLSASIDIFIHCAGFNVPKPAGELTRLDLEKTLQINAISFYDVVSRLIPAFKKKNSGCILGISSIYGSYTRKNRLAYASSKHALNAMIKTLALELGPYHVLVNGVAPGFVDTKMTSQNNDAATIAAFKRKIPLGQLAKPEQIASVCYFLCSKENSYINGEIVKVDGGYSQGGFQE